MDDANMKQDATRPEAADEAWSALVDGELGEHELQQLLGDGFRSDEVMARWHGYHVIGDVLRGGAPAATSVATGDFLAGVRARLQQESPPWQQPVGATVPGSVAAPVPVQADAARTSANESVFRWKLVAGLASLTAVVAVSWSVLGSLGAPVAGPQLAGVAPAAPAASAPAAVVTVSAEPRVQPAPLVVVQTGQGALIRDPHLEALMAEHRQHAGMSALQMPAGFLRNATFDAPSR